MNGEIKKVTPNFIRELADEDDDGHRFLSPVNLNLNTMMKIELQELKFLNMDSEPACTKVANTGQTVIVSGNWVKNRPKITGGPLLSTYAFSQLHYHWGGDSSHGSEHSYDDKKVPLEMHAVFLKENCKKQEEALMEKDGAVVVSYAYRLDDELNPGIKVVCDQLPYIPNPSQLIEFDDPIKLSTFVVPFRNDYFLYWGSVRTNSCKHLLLWIICRQAYVINEKQLQVFRSLFTSGNQPILNCPRHLHYQGYEVYHVNPSAYTEDVLYKKTENNVLKKVITPEKIKEMKRRRSSHGRYLFKKKNNHSNVSIYNQIPENEYNKQSKENKKYNLNTKKDAVCLQNSLERNFLNDESKENIYKEEVKNLNESDNIKGAKCNNSKLRHSSYRKFFSLGNKSVKENNTSKKTEDNKKKNITASVFSLETNDTPSLHSKKKKENEMIIQNKDSIDFSSQYKKEGNILNKLKNQYSEAREKLKNEILNTKKEEEDVNSLKYINSQKNSNLENSLFISNSKQLRIEDDERDMLDITSEHILEGLESNENQNLSELKQVTFNPKLNTNDENNDIYCYQIPSGTKLKLENILSESKLLNEYIGDCTNTENIKEENVKILTKETNKDSKTSQDIGINTMSLDELLQALTEERGTKSKHSNILNSIESNGTIFSENGCEEVKSLNSLSSKTENKIISCLTSEDNKTILSQETLKIKSTISPKPSLDENLIHDSAVSVPDKTKSSKKSKRVSRDKTSLAGNKSKKKMSKGFIKASILRLKDTRRTSNESLSIKTKKRTLKKGKRLKPCKSKSRSSSDLSQNSKEKLLSTKKPNLPVRIKSGTEIKQTSKTASVLSKIRNHTIAEFTLHNSYITATYRKRKSNQSLLAAKSSVQLTTGSLQNTPSPINSEKSEETKNKVSNKNIIINLESKKNINRPLTPVAQTSIFGSKRYSNRPSTPINATRPVNFGTNRPTNLLSTLPGNFKTNYENNIAQKQVILSNVKRDPNNENYSNRLLTNCEKLNKKINITNEVNTSKIKLPKATVNENSTFLNSNCNYQIKIENNPKEKVQDEVKKENITKYNLDKQNKNCLDNSSKLKKYNFINKTLLRPQTVALNRLKDEKFDKLMCRSKTAVECTDKETINNDLNFSVMPNLNTNKLRSHFTSKIPTLKMQNARTWRY